MKQLEKAKEIYLEEYEVFVRPYLTLEQVESIVNGICALENNDFSERKMCEDGLILYHATDIEKEEIESIPYEVLIESGLISAVRSEIKNIGLIQEGITYAESFTRSLSILAPKIIPMMEKLGDLYGKSADMQQSRTREYSL